MLLKNSTLWCMFITSKIAVTSKIKINKFRESVCGAALNGGVVLIDK